MAKPNNEFDDKCSVKKHSNKARGWPKIHLESDTKDDLLRSFQIFDKNGQGVISIDDLKVALRALGKDVDVREDEALKQKFPDNKIVFSDYVKILSDRILNFGEDLDISKTFSLFDTDGKGHIDLNDLRRVRDTLGLMYEVQDDELIGMLKTLQVKDLAQELKEMYAARQDKTRMRKNRGQGISGFGETDDGLDVHHIAPPQRSDAHRNDSSDDAYDPSELCVNPEQFKKLLDPQAFILDSS